MNGFLIMAGTLAVAILIIMIVKKIDDYREDRKVGTEISERIRSAAMHFADGASEEEVRPMLLRCIDLDEDDIDEILELSISYKNDDDGGYDAFVNITKHVLRNY